jgi:hypothetical protein
MTHAWEVASNDGNWTFDAFEEFIAEYKPGGLFSYVTTIGSTPSALQEQPMISRKFQVSPLTVSLAAPTRVYIQGIFNVVEQGLVQLQLEPKAKPPAIRVFLGHGRNKQWRDLKDHLQDQHGYYVQAFETDTRAGHTVRDILEEMLDTSSIAFLVLPCSDWRGRN